MARALALSAPSNSLTYGVIFKKPEEWGPGNGLNFQDRDGIAAFLANRFASWDARYQELFQATAYFWGLPTRKLSLAEPWKNNRPLPITLIGDAAHLMPPFAGQGVNMGLVDALVLAENLTGGKFETLPSAIHDYEQKMVVYAAAAQLETSKNEAVMRNPDFSFQEFIH